MRSPVILGSLVTVAALGLFAAGCGGGGNAPGVADLGTTAAVGTTSATTTTTQGVPGSGGKASGGRGGGPSGNFQVAMDVGTKDGAKFSACMRKHGVTNFPDPNGQGVITFHSGTGIDPGSPTFRSARSVCEKLLPNGGQPTPAQIAQRQQQLLAFSQCMRAHGLKDFPDPSSGGLKITGHQGSDLLPDNPTFQRAQQACQKYIPFKAAAGTAKVGGG